MAKVRDRYKKEGLNDSVAFLLASYCLDGHMILTPEECDKEWEYASENIVGKKLSEMKTIHLTYKALVVMFKGDMPHAVELLKQAMEIKCDTPSYNPKSISLLIENAPKIQQAMYKVYGITGQASQLSSK